MVYNPLMGTLYIVATPIGNLEDITIRAIKTLFSVDYIACEDTRRTGQLLGNLELRIKNQELGIKDLIIKKPKLISYYDEVEFQKAPLIAQLLRDGNNIALVSDAGTPLISDPGYKLIQACIKENITVTAIPGPSAGLTALTVSGLPANQFLFIGYLPSASNKRKKLLLGLQHWYCYSHSEVVKDIHPTVIFFETSHRIKETLADIKSVFGDIELVIARELTKIHEEVIRGKISEVENAVEDIKGELVLLFIPEVS